MGTGTPNAHGAGSAVQVSSEIRAEWRVVWPTVSVRFAASSWHSPPENWIISPAGYLVHRRRGPSLVRPFSGINQSRSAPSDINIVGNRGQVNSEGSRRSS